MPTYDYRCSKCQHSLEIFQKITDAPVKKCPECSQNSLQRGPGGGVGLAFKGSGFYITDYNAKPTENASKSTECCPCGKNQGSCSNKK